MRWVVLPCAKESDLNWALPELAGESIFWALDLNIDFPLEEELPFQALYLALVHFTEKVWPLYKEKTAGIALYQGRADFSTSFHWTTAQEENFAIWKEEQPDLPLAHLRRLFCSETFAYYFQKLSHALPDEVPITLCLDAVPDLPPSEMLQLVSKERFEHFSIAVRDVLGWEGLQWKEEAILPPNSSPIAICLPEDKRITKMLLQKLDALLGQFPDSVRVIPEPFLLESWEGVDKLYVLKDGVSPQGERKLKGFIAAGGEVCYV